MLEPKKINPDNYFGNNLEKQKIDILSDFCFEQVATIMATPCMPIYNNPSSEIIGYKPWAIYVNKTFKVPNVGDLYCLADQLLDDVIKEVYKDPKSNYQFIASGPFKVTYLYGNLTLDFVVESWGNY